MRGFAAMEIFENGWLDQWEIATEIVERVFDPDNEVRCHELARAVHKALCESVGEEFCTVEDGKFGAVEHSWIRLDPNTILDVYKPGSYPMVQLIHYSGLLPYWQNYKPRAPRDDINETKVKELFEQMTDGLTFPL